MSVMGGSECAVHSLVELYALQYELNEPADTEGSLAVPLLEDAFSSPEVLIASFGKAKQPFTPDCSTLHEQSSPMSKAKDSPAQVLQLIGCCYPNHASDAATEDTEDSVLVTFAGFCPGLLQLRAHC